MRIHPLVAGAAASVIVACGVGVAAMTGVLPRTQAEKAEALPPAAKKECAECGTVVSVRLVEQKGEGTGLGAVVGAWRARWSATRSRTAGTSARWSGPPAAPLPGTRSSARRGAPSTTKSACK